MANTAINRLSQSFADLQEGDCWIGINFSQALSDIGYDQAVHSIASHTNSIWQLVSHLVYWRTTVTNRLNGSRQTPAVPDFHLPDELNDANWQELLHKFADCYQRLQQALQQIDDIQLDQLTCNPAQTYHQLITGCLQHDAYHLGQIVVIKKLLAEI